MKELGTEIKKAFENHTDEIKFEVEILQLEEEGTAFAILNPALIEKLSNNQARLKEFRLLVDGTFRFFPTCGEKWPICIFSSSLQKPGT